MLLIRNVWLCMKGILRAARQIIARELEPLNLSTAEGDLLFLLLTGSNGLRQEEIAEQLDVGTAAVSRAVDSLETKGYVRRERHPEDRRAYSICLTEQAYAVQKEIIGIYERLYQRVSMGIPDEELERVEQLLDKVAVNLQSWRNN